MPIPRANLASLISDVSSVECFTPLLERLSDDNPIIYGRAVLECFARQRTVFNGILALFTKGNVETTVIQFDEDMFDYTTSSVKPYPIGVVTNGGDYATAQFSLESYGLQRRSVKQVLGIGGREIPRLPRATSVTDISVHVAYGGAVNNVGERPITPIASYKLGNTSARINMVESGELPDIRKRDSFVQHGFTPAEHDNLVGFEDVLAMVAQREEAEKLVTAFY